eukprot:tig00000142_g8648.t1
MDYYRVSLSVAGVATVLACIVSTVTILGHLRTFTRPTIQSRAIRIVLMVPVYSLSSWVTLWNALHLSRAADWIAMLRDFYQGFIVYQFFAMLSDFLGGERKLLAILAAKEPYHPFPPLCCLPPYQPGPGFLLRCRQGVLQFVFIKPLLAVAVALLQLFHWYNETVFEPDRAYIYLLVLENASISTAMYALASFYWVLRPELGPFYPVLKFFCIKWIVFFNFWQGVVIAALFRMGYIVPVPPFEQRNVAIGIQGFLICLEMFLAAAVFSVAFSAEQFEPGRHRAAPRTPTPTAAYGTLPSSAGDEEAEAEAEEPLLLARLSRALAFGDLWHDTFHTFVRPSVPHHRGVSLARGAAEQGAPAAAAGHGAPTSAPRPGP